jgi:hypothetical protein
MEKREELEPMASVGSMTPPISMPSGVVRSYNFIARISEGRWRGLTGIGMLEQRPDVCTPMAANPAGKYRLQIGQVLDRSSRWRRPRLSARTCSRRNER